MSPSQSNFGTCLRRAGLFMCAYILLAASAVARAATAGLVYGDAALIALIDGPYTFEDFGTTYSYPISTGELNSLTSIPDIQNGDPIQPGRVLPGVTYSSPVGTTANYFNLDYQSAGTGAFLSGYDDGRPDRKLTITFDSPMAAVGFETRYAFRNITLNISFEDGSTATLTPTYGLTYIGLVAHNEKIRSLVFGADTYLGLAFIADNVIFAPAVVPEPSTFAAMISGLIALAFVRRRRLPRLSSRV